MKYKRLLLLALCIIGSQVVLPPLSTYAAEPVVLATGDTKADTTKPKEMCPKGSIRNPDGKSPNPSDVTNPAQCNIPAPEKDAATGEEKNAMYYITRVVNVILAVVGIVAVVMIILGGISMITSQGDTGKVAKGRLTIIYGVVGLVIALLAFAIVNFALTSIF